MAEMDYEKRKQMTDAQKMKEAAWGALKGLFSNDPKPTPAAVSAPPVKQFQDMGSQTAADIAARRAEELKALKQYKKGGKVTKTGPAILHKNERVLTVKQAKSPAIKKALKKCSTKAC